MNKAQLEAKLAEVEAENARLAALVKPKRDNSPPTLEAFKGWADDCSVAAEAAYEAASTGDENATVEAFKSLRSAGDKIYQTARGVYDPKSEARKGWLASILEAAKPAESETPETPSE